MEHIHKIHGSHSERSGPSLKAVSTFKVLLMERKYGAAAAPVGAAVGRLFFQV